MSEPFFEYASRYEHEDGRVRLKIDHTIKVCRIMDELTAWLGLDEHDRFLAHTVALYHDIGRFEQLRQYGTFVDHRSVDHADLGVQILKDSSFLDALDEEDRRIVLFAVENHNKYRIGPCDERTRLFARLIRDADKCDIFRVFACEDLNQATSTSIEQIKDDVVSDEIEQMIMAHRPIVKEKRKTGLDVWITFLGFFFDMNFSKTMEIAREQGYYRLLFDQIRFHRCQDQIDRILQETERFMDEQLKQKKMAEY